MNATTESPPFPGSLRRSLEDRRYSPACHCTDCECARTRIFLTARTPCLAQVFDSSAQDDATYIHHLVHMREGQFPGEFGTGWNNAGFWAGSVDDHPTFPQVSSPTSKRFCKLSLQLALVSQCQAACNRSETNAKQHVTQARGAAAASLGPDRSRVDPRDRLRPPAGRLVASHLHQVSGP